VKQDQRETTLRDEGIVESYATIDALLEQWKSALGTDYSWYRNHVYRIFNFTCRLAGATGDDIEKVAIAAAFHDVGIWLDDTFDYLEPSARHASDYLIQIGRAAWMDAVHQMIDQHHRIRPWHGSEQSLVESFRKADWLDVCLFVLPTRLERDYLTEVLRRFPRNGFHRRLVAFTLRWWKRHPLNPLPILKW
jgi:hypothetical protein